MKCSDITRTALLLAAGLSFALTSVGTAATEVFEDFADQNGKTIIGTTAIGTHSNLTWSASGTADLSEVKNGKLAVDTEGDTIAAEIASAQATTLNAALTGTKPEGANGEIYLNAKVAFVPSDELETFPTAGTDDLKFAIYAYEHLVGADTVTNLVVFHGSGIDPVCTNDVISNITFSPQDGEKQVVVTMKDDSGLKFKVEVGGVEAQSALAADGWFKTVNATARTTISAINIQGTGTIDDIALGYNENAGFNAGDVEAAAAGTTITLTQAEADYLNAIVAKGKTPEAITTKIAGLTHDQLTTARLLNVDLVEADFSDLYTFSVTDVKRVSSATATNIVVTVALDRKNCKVSQAINGIVVLKTTNNGVNYTDSNSAVVTDDNFSEGDTTTVTFQPFPVGFDTTFFKAVIEEAPAPAQGGEGSGN